MSESWWAGRRAGGLRDAGGVGWRSVAFCTVLSCGSAYASFGDFMTWPSAGSFACYLRCGGMLQQRCLRMQNGRVICSFSLVFIHAIASGWLAGPTNTVVLHLFSIPCFSLRRLKQSKV